MKVVWFVNIPFPAVAEELGLKPGPGGGWLPSLADSLVMTSDLDLHIAWSSAKVRELTSFRSGQITYHCLPSRNPAVELLRNRVFFRLGGGFVYAAMELIRSDYSRDIDVALEVVNRVQPDIVHVHGCEEFYGLITTRAHQPVVVSMQGLLEICVADYWAKLPLRDRIALGPYAWFSYLILCRKERLERRVIQANRMFSCRTLLDEAFVHARRPEANVFFDGGRVLRREFASVKWGLAGAQSGLIYTTMTPRPYKGTHDLLEAVAILKARHPHLRIHIAGPLSNHGYSRFLKDLARRRGIADFVEFTGQLNATEVAKQLGMARVFVIASHAENSPNSLAEAQYVGTPCVAAYAGGTVSMASDGVNALCYPAGNIFLLAHALNRLVSDDNLCLKLSEGARIEAERRNDPKSIATRQLEIYNSICGNALDVDSRRGVWKADRVPAL